MGNETLKKLAQDYAIGQIDRYNYRQQRALLIDEITGYQNPDQNNSAPTHLEIDNSQQLANTSETSRSSFNSKVIIIAALVVAIIVAAIVLRKKDDNIDDNNDKQANTTSQLIPHNAESLVNTFINYDDWTSERISQFVAGWQRLTDLQKQEAKQASWFQGLIDMMKKRLSEYQKVAKTGSHDAQQKAQGIKNLSVLLGIRL